MSAVVLCLTGMCLILLLMAEGSAAAETILPEGSAPPALSSGYFPSRLHEFVWRNWNLIPPAKLGRIVGASEGEITHVAASMGLPSATSVPPEMLARGYVTMLRRNWHLLPYEQMTELLEVTPERLNFMLREDDCLWYKLGQLKPKCERLRYEPPTAEAQRRTAEIRRVVEEEFGQAISAPQEPRFEFVRKLSTPDPSYAPPSTQPPGLRLAYSYLATYGDPLLKSTEAMYPDGLLQRLSGLGINGVWMHAVLREMAPGGDTFPEFGEDHEVRLANLRALVERAARYGIRVFLYFNEPRAMPPAFFERRPELAGVAEEGLTALCTSHPAVRQWISDALAHIFRQVPGLGGMYNITASENLTNCASHFAREGCPRCQGRSDDDIIVELIETFEQGVHRGNPDAQLIVSDWGWKAHGDARAIIPRLPQSAMLMSVSEWSKEFERGGVTTQVGEYSISVVGPGPRATMHWQAAREAGLRTAGEVQFNNSTEIGDLPYLPFMDLVAEHCHNLAATGVEGMLIGWTLGGHPSPNLQLAQAFTRRPVPDIETALEELAQERFGPQGAPHARRAWTALSEAYREYPFHGKVVYYAPVQFGPANPLYPVQTGYAANMWGLPYDDLETWRGPYPGAIFASQFEKLADGWGRGLPELEAAVRAAPAERQQELQADVRYARAAGLQFRSTANQARFVIARDALADADHPLTPDERRECQEEMRRCARDEIALTRQLFDLSREDSRVGFEPATHYFYVPLDLVEKVINCRWLLDQQPGIQ